MRKFAPDKYRASAGYDLRKWGEVGDIPKNRAAMLRHDYRLLRPLLVYGFKRKGIKQHKKLKEYYSALYGMETLPGGLQYVPLPLRPDDTPARVTVKRGVASVRVSDNITMTRLTWEQMGYCIEDVLDGDLDFICKDIFARFEPDYVGISAGISRVKNVGMIKALNSPRMLAMELGRLMGKYDSGNHAVSNWLEGLEFYEFHKAPSDTAYKKGRTPEQKAMFRWLDDEQDRYKARAKISRKIKNVTGRIKRLKDRYKSFNLVLKGRIKGAIPRSELLAIQNDYDKKLIDLTGVRDSLIRQLHLTRGF